MAVVKNISKLAGESSYHIDDKLVKKWEVIKDGGLVKEDNDKLYIVDGRERCLTGDTQIQASRYKVSKRYSLKTLYNHYNGIKNRGKIFDLSEPSRVRSFNGREIRLHEIKNVVSSGVKPVFELTLENGYKIKATADHKIMTDKGFVELQNLKDDLVMCDTLKAESKKRKRIKLYDIALRVGQNHPFSSEKGRVGVHILIYEARLNNLEFTEYLDILLNEPEKCKELEFVDINTYIIHHQDGCHYNNSIENLEKMEKNEHLVHHGAYSNFSQGVPKFSKVVSTEYIGEEETYDIVCENPHHNFVANGIVVHNSGKSLWAFQQAAHIDPTFVDRFLKGGPAICFEGEDVLKGIKKLESTKEVTRCLVFDEAFRGLSNRATLSRVNKLIVQALMEMGQKNLVLFIVLPSFFLLDRYPAVLRSNALFHIQRPRKRSPTAGRQWKAYNFNKKATLYNMGINKGWGYPLKTRFRGKFFGRYPGGDIFEVAYRKIKRDALHDIETSIEKSGSRMGVREKKWVEQRNQLLVFIKSLGYNPAKIVREAGIDLSEDAVRQAIKTLTPPKKHMVVG